MKYTKHILAVLLIFLGGMGTGLGISEAFSNTCSDMHRDKSNRIVALNASAVTEDVRSVDHVRGSSNGESSIRSYRPQSHRAQYYRPQAGLAAAPIAAPSAVAMTSAESGSRSATDSPRQRRRGRRGQRREERLNVGELGQRVAVSVRAGRSYGAGVLVDESLVLTALHVIEPSGTQVELKFHDGHWRSARVLATDTANDVAVLEVATEDRTPVELAEASELHIGDGLWAVGNPRELGFTVQRGIVSFIGRRFGTGHFIQTDLPANPGSSGGPVLDERGRLVGIMGFILRDSEGIAFVTPLTAAESVLAAAESVLAESVLAEAEMDSAETSNLALSH